MVTKLVIMIECLGACLATAIMFRIVADLRRRNRIVRDAGPWFGPATITIGVVGTLVVGWGLGFIPALFLSLVPPIREEVVKASNIGMIVPGLMWPALITDGVTFVALFLWSTRPRFKRETDHG